MAKGVGFDNSGNYVLINGATTTIIVDASGKTPGMAVLDPVLTGTGFVYMVDGVSSLSSGSDSVNYWQRVGTVISPATTGDSLKIASIVVGGAESAHAESIASGHGAISAPGVGAFAQGYTGYSCQIIASGRGSFATGYYSFPDGGVIEASGDGSFAGGAGQAIASGVGAFAYGADVTASAQLATAFGEVFTNSVENSFAIGYGQKDFYVLAHTVGIPSTSYLQFDTNQGYFYSRFRVGAQNVNLTYVWPTVGPTGTQVIQGVIVNGEIILSFADAGSGGVTAVTGTAPITSSGGNTPEIGITAADATHAGSVPLSGTPSVNKFLRATATTGAQSWQSIVVADITGLIAGSTWIDVSTVDTQRVISHKTASTKTASIDPISALTFVLDGTDLKVTATGLKTGYDANGHATGSDGDGTPVTATLALSELQSANTLVANRINMVNQKTSISPTVLFSVGAPGDYEIEVYHNSASRQEGSSVHGTTNSVITLLTGHGFTDASDCTAAVLWGEGFVFSRTGMTILSYTADTITVVNSSGTGDTYPADTVPVLVVQDYSGKAPSGSLATTISWSDRNGVQTKSPADAVTLEAGAFAEGRVLAKVNKASDIMFQAAITDKSNDARFDILLICKQVNGGTSSVPNTYDIGQALSDVTLDKDNCTLTPSWINVYIPPAE